MAKYFPREGGSPLILFIFPTSSYYGCMDGWTNGWMDENSSPLLDGVCKSVRLCTNHIVTELVLFSQPLQNNNNTI
jgi:hypothetical protein